MSPEHNHQTVIFFLGLLLAMLAPHAASAQTEPPAYKAFRYDEDYRYLRDPTTRTDFWDPIKYVPLGRDPDVYLSLGGELRERSEYFSAPGFGLGNSGADAYLLHRLLLSGDFHAGEDFRVFVQLGNELEAGKDDPLSPTDVDRLDLQQAFVDAKIPNLYEFRPTLRVGRQEMAFGSQRLVSAREPPNIRRSFDGFRLMGINNNVNVDAFVTRPVLLKQGNFDDIPDHEQAFWGIYSTVSATPSLSFDIYYLGLDNEKARFGALSGDEHRHSLGARLFGAADGWDWNFEVVGQLGDFVGQDIRAWTIASDTGYGRIDLPWRPRFGLKANIASGDSNISDRAVGTFNPLFPKLGYFSEASLVAPSNFFDFQPSVSLAPTDALSISVGWDFLWRETTGDAVYTEPFIPVLGTAGQDGRFIGHQVSLDIGWQVDRHVEITASYVHFTVGDALRAVGSHDVDFVMVSAAYKF